MQRSKTAVFWKQCRGSIAGLSVLMLLQSLLQVSMALLTRSIIDSALNSDGKLLSWGAVLVGNVLLLVAIHTGLSWLSGKTMDHTAANLRAKLLNSAVFSHDIRLEQFHSGQLLSRGMEDVYTVCDGMVSALPSLVGQLSRLIAAFAAVLLVAPKVALVLLSAVLVIVLLTALIRPVLKKHHRIVREKDEAVLSLLQEDLQQLELIQSLDAQNKILDHFQKAQKSSLKAKSARRLWSVSAGSIMNVGSLIGTGALLLWGGSQVAAGGISYGALTSMLQLFSLFRGPALGISGLWTRLAGVEVAAERLLNLLECVPAAEKQEVGNVTHIIFDNVTFCYPGEEVPALKGFSAVFPVENWACLTGISGKGKTTLFKLILGLYVPQEGTVKLRTDEGDIPCGEGTRHLFAYVPQDFALFSGSIRENLQLVCDADEAAMEQALKIAQADFVWELAAKDLTQVRENNTGLSKGQLQRLAIARAILMERPILLLDECTSALDAQTEAAVLQGLYGLGRQAILVTHRPEALDGLAAITPVSI